MPHSVRASRNSLRGLASPFGPADLKYRVGTRMGLALVLLLLGLVAVRSDLEEPTLVALSYSVGTLLASLSVELSMVWYAPRWMTAMAEAGE